MSVVIINAGSSSIKFGVEENGTLKLVGGIILGKTEKIEYAVGVKIRNACGEVIHKKTWTRADSVSRDQALRYVLHVFKELGITFTAIGHRVVHGGSISRPTLITLEVLDVIKRLCVLVPLHNTVALGPIQTFSEMFPEMPQVAVFDTAFHTTIQLVNQGYGLPDDPQFEHIVRYGFHGTNYEWVASQLSKYIVDPMAGDHVIVDHAGSGHSMCLVRYEDGAWKSHYCTLGFGTSGNGPLHATRAVLDADATLELVRVCGSVDEAQRVLLKDSGIKGRSMLTDDLAEVYRAAHEEGHSNALCKLAIDEYLERSIEAIGSLAAKAHAHGRLRAVVWTAGVGEKAPWYRRDTARAVPGLMLDDVQNEASGEGVITIPTSHVLGLIVPANEELMIARHVRKLQHDQRVAA